MQYCMCCQKQLTHDEIGIYKKMVNRGAESFLCLECLAEHFRVQPDSIRKKIEYFKKTGCTLFQ